MKYVEHLQPGDRAESIAIVDGSDMTMVVDPHIRHVGSSDLDNLGPDVVRNSFGASEDAHTTFFGTLDQALSEGVVNRDLVGQMIGDDSDRSDLYVQVGETTITALDARA